MFIKILLIILFFVTFFISFCLFYRKLNGLNEIKFQYSIIDWIPLMFLYVIIFFACFFIELYVSCKIKNFDDDSFLILLFKMFVKNGLLIPFICILMSYYFGRAIEYFNLDYSEFYSCNIVKIYFSFLILGACIKMMCLIYNSPEDVEFFITRLLMWIITVIGTWLGIGYGCEGRIERERKKRSLIEKKEKYSKKEFIQFWAPIFIILLFLENLLMFANVSIYTNILRDIFIAVSLGIIVSLFYFFLIIAPGPFICKSRLKKLIYGKTSQIKFRRYICALSDNVIKVSNFVVIYEDNDDEDDEFNKLFDDFEIEIETVNGVINIDKISQVLEDKWKNQKKYINNESKKCKYIQREKMLNG